MDAMKSKLVIEYNNVDATDIIADDCDSFTWKDNASGAADTITLSLANINQKWMNGFYPLNRMRLRHGYNCRNGLLIIRKGKYIVERSW